MCTLKDAYSINAPFKTTTKAPGTSVCVTVCRFPSLHPRRETEDRGKGDLPNSLETGDTAAFSPIFDIASKYNFPARVIAGKMIKLLLIFV